MDPEFLDGEFVSRLRLFQENTVLQLSEKRPWNAGRDYQFLLEEMGESQLDNNNGCDGCLSAVPWIVLGLLFLGAPGIGWFFGVLCFLFAYRKIFKG